MNEERSLRGLRGSSFILHLYFSAGGSVAARREGRPFEAVRKELLVRASDDPATMRSEAWSLLRTDLPGYAKTHAAGMLRTMFDPGAVEYLRTFGAYPESGGALTRSVDRGIVDAALNLALILAPLVVLALFHARRQALLAAIVIYFFVMSGGVPGSSRFRVPVVPLLALLTAYARLPRCLRSPSSAAPHSSSQATSGGLSRGSGGQAILPVRAVNTDRTGTIACPPLVGVPVFDEAALIDRKLDNFAALAGTNRIVLVDGGSTS